MQAFAAGLYDKWTQDTFPSLLKAGYFQRLDVIKEEPQEPVDIMVFVLYGWLFSCLVFVAEIIYFY